MGETSGERETAEGEAVTAEGKSHLPSPPHLEAQRLYAACPSQSRGCGADPVANAKRRSEPHP